LQQEKEQWAYMQGLKKIMETLQILYTFLYQCDVEPPFAFNTAAVLLGMDSYKFWAVTSAILNHLSWRICPSCFRDVGSGNLFLSLVTRTTQSGSVVCRSSDCAGQGRCWSSPSCSSNYDWIVPAVWMEALSSWKSASLFENNAWIVGCTWLPNLSAYSLEVIRPWKVIMGPTEYHEIAAQTITEPPPYFIVGTRHSRL
jgi:hypothetical protein